MGHDIVAMWRKGVEDGRVAPNESSNVGHFYVSFNWSDMVFNGCHFHGRNSEEIVILIDSVLTKLRLLGYSKANPDKNNPNWSWGTKDGHELPLRDRVEIYMHHLEFYRDHVLQTTRSYFENDLIHTFWYSYQSGYNEINLNPSKFPPTVLYP